jgi:DNA-binding beta-propeller fold protein YncE
MVQLGTSGSIAYNTNIYAIKTKTMKATALGIYYQQIPYGYVISPQGKVLDVKEHNGSLFIWVNRKRKPISKIPKLNYDDAMEFKKIFCQ